MSDWWHGGPFMNAMPQWTELVDKRGLDPLGMQNSGVAFYQRLVPGISNVTLRMRYYGFYCWLSDAYARHEGSTNYEDWRRWVRRAEALFALVSSIAGSEGGVGGIDWANTRLKLGEDEIDFAAAASNSNDVKTYLNQSMGVFGGAYYTQMVEFGLFVEGDHGIPKATKDRGLALAGAFREAIGTELEALLIAKIMSAHVTRTELETLKPVAPSKIAEESSERDAYEKALFAISDTTSGPVEGRHATLQLLLYTTNALGSRPDPDTIRWFLFKGAGQDFPESLEPQRLRWEAYQAHDLFQLAAAAFLAYAIALMGETEGGMSLEEIADEVLRRWASSEPESVGKTWAEYRDQLHASDEQLQSWSLAIAGRRNTPEAKARDAVRLIAALHQRIDDRPDLAAEINHSLRVAGQARSIWSELAWLRDRDTMPVAELLAEYVVHRVVRRHTWVAMQKLRRQRDYTFLFEARDGRFTRRADYMPVATTPRLAPAMQFLADIHLLAQGGLTTKGLAIAGAVS